MMICFVGGMESSGGHRPGKDQFGQSPEKKEETIPTTAIEAAIRITMARRNVGG